MVDSQTPETPPGRAAATKDQSWKALSIPAALYARVRLLARDEGVSVALQARRLIEAALKA